MAARKIKRKQTARKAQVEKPRSVWLAGLGAVSVARKQGNELFASLIAEGSEFQVLAQKLVTEIRSDTRTQVKDLLVPLRARIRNSANKAAVTCQRGVAVVLAQLGIPSKAAVEELSQRVATLSRQLRAAK
jgi:poly(hydroxyalkanoate) granule-associated protein